MEDQRGPREMMMRGLDEENKKKYIRSIEEKKRRSNEIKKSNLDIIIIIKKSNIDEDLQSDLTDADSTTDGDNEEDFMCLKKVKKR